MTAPVIAFFVSGHGFGHAARGAAVIEACRLAIPDVVVHLVTDAPSWIFAVSTAVHRYHHEHIDPGLVQATPVREDLPASLARLDAFHPFSSELVDGLAHLVDREAIDLVVTDIAPVAIAAGREAGVPVVLVENFTWDQIFESCVETHPEFARHADYVRDWYGRADYRVATRPLLGAARGDAVVGPVARAPRRPRDVVRAELGVPVGGRLVLVAMGGAPWAPAHLSRFAARDDTVFVVCSDSVDPPVPSNIRFVPASRECYMPDISHAADVVVGKMGYSTVAEAYDAGARFGVVPRPAFAEAAALEEFVMAEMGGVRLGADEFNLGLWIDRLPELEGPRFARGEARGAAEVAEFVRGVLSGVGSQ